MSKTGTIEGATLGDLRKKSLSGNGDDLVMRGIGQSAALVNQINGSIGGVFLGRRPLMSDAQFLHLMESNEGLFPSSLLSHGRMLEIFGTVATDTVAHATWVATRAVARPSRLRGEVDYTKAQWVTAANTDPVELAFDPNLAASLDEDGVEYEIFDVDDKKMIRIRGAKISFSFPKIPCIYRLANPQGITACTHCNLSGAMSGVNIKRAPTPADQLLALEDGLAKAKDFGVPMLVFEIIPEGSYLNDNEVSPEIQIGMMRRLAEERQIHRVSIETRPQNITVARVKEILEALRRDQELEIYLGLETTDSFVESVILRNGYGLTEFEAAMWCLAGGLSKDEFSRLKITVYHFFQPPYLTDKESIDDAVLTAEKIKDLANRIGISIKVKYEPAVVSEDTLQEFLYMNDRYNSPSYFSVAELIAILIQKNLNKMAKIGARDDIDTFFEVPKVASVADPRLFSPWDYMVYNACHNWYSNPEDVASFLSDIVLAIQYSEEFKLWEKKVYGQCGASALSKLIKDFEDSGNTYNPSRINFQRDIWKVCDRVEYDRGLSQLASSGSSENARAEIGEAVAEKFKVAGIDVVLVRNVILVDADKQANSLKADNLYLVEVVIKSPQGLPQSVWMKVPFKFAGEAEKPDYIYQAA